MRNVHVFQFKSNHSARISVFYCHCFILLTFNGRAVVLRLQPSRPLPEMLSPRGQSDLEAKSAGLGLKHLASVCSRWTSSQEETDQSDYRSSHNAQGKRTDDIEDRHFYCVRENEKLKCVVLVMKLGLYKFSCMLPIIIWYFLFIALFLAMALASTWEIGLGLGLGLEIVSSFNITDCVLLSDVGACEGRTFVLALPRAMRRAMTMMMMMMMTSFIVVIISLQCRPSVMTHCLSTSALSRTYHDIV